jgi:hypothetical protein
MVLQQIADILKTPVILAGVISPGASIPKALLQVTEEKEGKGNAGGPAEGNDANAQLGESILQQIAGILKAPVVQAGAVSPGASGSPALPQVTEEEEEEEEEGNAGDPTEGDDAIAQTNAAAKARADAAAAIANAEAAALQANAAKEKAQTQATQVQEPFKSTELQRDKHCWLIVQIYRAPQQRHKHCWIIVQIYRAPQQRYKH